MLETRVEVLTLCFHIQKRAQSPGRPKTDMLRHRATQKKGMLRPLHCNRKWVCCSLERPKQFALLFASQNRYVATLCDPERYVATNAIKMSMLRLCATEMFERLYPVQKKDYVATIATQNAYVATIVIQNGKKQPLR